MEYRENALMGFCGLAGRELKGPGGRERVLAVGRCGWGFLILWSVGVLNTL